MRLRDVMQVIKNIPSNVTVKMNGTSALPSVEMRGEGLFDIHRNSIWVSSIVGDCFLKSRILWEDSKHEFRFVSSDKRGVVCRDAMLNVAKGLNAARGQTGRATSAELAILTLIIATEAITEVAAKNLVVSVDDYNNWVIDTGGGADEKITEDEHLTDLLEAVRCLRRDTYPLWYSLVDLLPDGVIKEEAEKKLRSGSNVAGIDTEDVMPDWQIVFP